MTFMPMAPTAEAKVREPDWKGVSPNPSWNIIGRRKGVPPMAMRKTLPPMMEAR